MKLKTFLLMSLLFTGTVVSAQSKAEAKLAAAVESLRLAMISGDSLALDAITTPDLSYGHSSGKIEDKAAFIRAFVSGSSDFITIDLTNQTIRVYKTGGIVTHTLTAKTNDNGVPGNVNIVVLTVWQKHHGKWLMAARQAVRPR